MDSKPKWRVRAARSIARLLFVGALLALPASAHATFPGQNGKIAFTRFVSNDCHSAVYTINPDGSGMTNVSNGEWLDVLPQWSPDGRTIAFESSRDVRCAPRFSVYTMNPDGGGQTRLTGAEHQPSWDPMGGRIAWVSENSETGTGDVFISNSDGSGTTQVTSTPDGNYHYPTWAPAGDRLTFAATRIIYYEHDYEPIFSPNEIAVVNADGSGYENITNTPDISEGPPTWSPDGTRIAFPLNGSTFIVNPNGSDRTNLFGTGGGIFFGWSPDGTKILFAPCCPWVNEIFVMDADGTDVRLVTNDGFSPKWSPDGKKIVFERNDGRYGYGRLWTINIDGSDLRQLTPDAPGGEYAANWQPLPPERSDFKNAPQFCRAERALRGRGAFDARYATNGNGSNAFGKCVSANGG